MSKLLLETGDALLLETGDSLLLEESGNAAVFGLLATSLLSTQGVSGTVSGSIGDFTLSAAAQTLVQASTSASIGDFSLSAATTTLLQGSLSGSIGDFGLTASGQITAQGAATTSIGDFLLSATARIEVEGELSDSIGDFTLDAQGVAGVAVTAELSGSIGDFVLSATGEAEQIVVPPQVTGGGFVDPLRYYRIPTPKDSLILTGTTGEDWGAMVILDRTLIAQQLRRARVLRAKRINADLLMD